MVGNLFFDFIDKYKLWYSDRTDMRTKNIKPRYENNICSADLPLPGHGKIA